MKKFLSILALFVAAAHLAFAASIQFNFAGASSVEGWNRVPASVGTSDDGTLTKITDANGQPTNVVLKMNSRFGGVNKNGPSTDSSPNRFGIPDAVMETSFYSNTELFGGKIAPNPSFTLSGLDPKRSYTFVIYAGRMGAKDNRTGNYQATGANSIAGQVDAANNTDTPLRLKGIRPTPAGEITLSITAAPANTNAHGFFYLNALVVESE